MNGGGKKKKKKNHKGQRYGNKRKSASKSNDAFVLVKVLSSQDAEVVGYDCSTLSI